MKIAS